MGLHSHSKESLENGAIQTKEMPRGILVIRLVIASIIFAVSAVVSMPAIVKTILLAIATLIAGYDIILDAINSIESGDYFGVSVVILFVAVLAFVFGYGIEAAAMVILFKVAHIVSDYVAERTLLSAEELLRYRDEEEIRKTIDTAGKAGAGSLEISDSIEAAASFVLKILIGVAVAFAILAPLTTHLSVRESIHRALSIIVIATPASVLLSLPLAGVVGIFSAARYGTLFNTARGVEKLSDVKTLIVDKAGVLAEECPKLLSVKSDILDTNTFLTFAAHAVYYSEQPIAKALANATDGEYKLEVISNFAEIPGSGVEVDIGGAHVTLGKIAISNSTLDSVENLVTDFRGNGVERCVLISEDGREETAAFASKFGFDDAYGELDVEKKLALIDQISTSVPSAKLYLYSSGIESHSKADIDVRVSKAGKYADALVNPSSITMLPSVFHVAGRIREVVSENAIFSIAIKAILVFLSINGWCNIWFAMFVDSAASIATQLNAIRVSSDSFLKGMIRRREEEEEFAEDEEN